MSSTRLGGLPSRASVVFSSFSRSHRLKSFLLARTKRCASIFMMRQSSISSSSSSFMRSSKSRSQMRMELSFFMRMQLSKGQTNETVTSSSWIFSSLFLEVGLISQILNLSFPKAYSWLLLLSSSCLMSADRSYSPIFLALKSKSVTWDLDCVAFPNKSYISVSFAFLKVTMRSQGYSLMKSNSLAPIISLFLTSFFFSSVKGVHLKMYFLTSPSASSLRMKRMLPSLPTMEESISILYSNFKTAFLATSFSFSKSQISILLCFSTWYSFSTQRLMVASSIRQTCVSLILRILRMISLGKLWIMRSLSFFQTMMVFFSKLMPTSCPLVVRYKFSMGYLSDSAQKSGSALFSSFHLLTPWLLMLQYSLVSPFLEMTFLKSSFSLVKDPISLPPFLEQRVILLSLISLQVSRSMSATQLSSLMRLYLSSNLRMGSISSMLFVPRQKRQTLGVESMDSMMATSSRSSLHSSNSGRRTSTGSYLRSTLPSFPIFQQNMSLFSPSSSDVSMLMYPFFASTFSIMASISTLSITCSFSMETIVNLYMPKTTTRLSLSGLILAQNWSSLCRTSMDFLKTMPSNSQMKSSVPSMSSRQLPRTVVSQSEGRERQYLLLSHANPPYYFMQLTNMTAQLPIGIIKTTNMRTQQIGVRRLEGMDMKQTRREVFADGKDGKR